MSQHGWTEKGYYTTIHDDGPVYQCADCGRLHGDAYAICQPCADKARAAHLAKFTVEESAAFEDQRLYNERGQIKAGHDNPDYHLNPHLYR